MVGVLPLGKLGGIGGGIVEPSGPVTGPPVVVLPYTPPETPPVVEGIGPPGLNIGPLVAGPDTPPPAAASAAPGAAKPDAARAAPPVAPEPRTAEPAGPAKPEACGAGVRLSIPAVGANVGTVLVPSGFMVYEPLPRAALAATFSGELNHAMPAA